MQIKQEDGAFSENVANCNGGQALIVASRKCYIPVSVLRDVPYAHEWGASIYATVSATNVLGTSADSAEGNGAIMLTVPDAPVGLSNLPDVTNGS